MANIDHLIYPPLFSDSFRYRGSLDLPGSETLPAHWDAVSGAFTTKSERHLEVTATGEMVYSGTRVNILAHRLSTSGDYAIVIMFYSQKGLAFQLRGRRESSTKYIAVSVDLDGTLALIEENSGTTTLIERNYNWNLNEQVYYNIQLWMIGQTAYAFVNSSPVFSAAIPAVTKEIDGFSLSVSNLGTASKARFHKFGVHQLISYPSPTLPEDGSDLFLLYRKLIKEQIEESAIHDWDNFKKARQFWNLHRNLGHRNDIWESMGYPIRQPYAEEWLNS